MHRRFIRPGAAVLLVLAALLCACSKDEPLESNKETQAAAAAWETYKTAALAKDGPADLAGLRAQGLDEDEFVLDLVGAGAGRTIGEEIWDPPKG